MYSEVLCKCERAGENAINYNKRKILHPHKTQGRGSCHCPGASTPLSPPPLCCHFAVPVIILISATSSCHPWPSCSLFPPNKQLLVMAVGGPVVVVVVVVMAVLLPLVIVVVAQLEVLSRRLLFCCCFPCHCPPCRQGLAMVVWA